MQFHQMVQHSQLQTNSSSQKWSFFPSICQYLHVLHPLLNGVNLEEVASIAKIISNMIIDYTLRLEYNINYLPLLQKHIVEI